MPRYPYHTPLTLCSSTTAAFLGDANFPYALRNAPRGKKILQFQKLYEDYSRLDITEPTDRPVAIAGLEERLLAALGVSGGFGVFDEEDHSHVHEDGDGRGRGLFRRSLLWCRGEDTTSLERIKFASAGSTSNGHNTAGYVPSWSWMAYSGGISYITPRFGEVDWAKKPQSPWKTELHTAGAEKYSNDKLAPEDYGLIVKARGFRYNIGSEAEAKDDRDNWLVMDRPDFKSSGFMKCVILGRARKSFRNTLVAYSGTRHYVLVICKTPRQDAGGRDIYERVGAGYLTGRRIHWSKTVDVVIY